jgi:Flp pilus assembly protein TadG
MAAVGDYGDLRVAKRGLGRGQTRSGRLNRRQKGAALVEFAILMPLLVLLLLGIVEFGWGLAQQIDVRHKAREALRLVIVDSPQADIEARVCGNDIVPSAAVTEISLDTGLDPGTAATVTVTANLQQITGLFGPFWGPNPTISSTVEGRVEQATTAFIPPVDLAPCP